MAKIQLSDINLNKLVQSCDFSTYNKIERMVYNTASDLQFARANLKSKVEWMRDDANKLIERLGMQSSYTGVNSCGEFQNMSGIETQVGRITTLEEKLEQLINLEDDGVQEMVEKALMKEDV